MVYSVNKVKLILQCALYSVHSWDICLHAWGRGDPPKATAKNTQAQKLTECLDNVNLTMNSVPVTIYTKKVFKFNYSVHPVHQELSIWERPSFTTNYLTKLYDPPPFYEKKNAKKILFKVWQETFIFFWGGGDLRKI